VPPALRASLTGSPCDACSSAQKENDSSGSVFSRGMIASLHSLALMACLGFRPGRRLRIAGRRRRGQALRSRAGIPVAAKESCSASRRPPTPPRPRPGTTRQLREVLARRAQRGRAAQAPRQPVRPRMAGQRHDRRRQTTPSIRPLLQGDRPGQTETPEANRKRGVTKAGATGVGAATSAVTGRGKVTQRRQASHSC
jgi:hypothetical protein